MLDIKQRTLCTLNRFPFVCLFTFTNYVLVCVHVRKRGRDRENLWELVPSFHHVRSRDHTQVLDLAAINYLYLLSHLIAPSSVLLPLKVLFGSF